MAVAGTGTPVIVSRTVPAAADTVLITAVDAATAEDGLPSPVTEHTIAAFKVAAVVSVIWRRPAEKVVDATGALRVALVQVAVGVPANVGKPVTEIKVTAFVASVPVKLTVKIAAADCTLLLNAVEAVYPVAGTGTPAKVSTGAKPEPTPNVDTVEVVAAAVALGVVRPETAHNTAAALKARGVPMTSFKLGVE